MTSSYQRSPDYPSLWGLPLTYPEPTSDRRPSGVVDPRPDSCPACRPHRRVVHPPIHVGCAESGTGYYCTYLCSRCKYVWFTGWANEEDREDSRG